SSMLEIQPCHLFAILDDVKDPIVTLASEAVGGCAARDRSAVPRNWERAGKGSEARIDHVSNTANCNREKHVLTHAFAPWFEQDDASGVRDGSEADGFESGVHETAMFETIAAAVARNDLGLQAPGVETDGATK